MRDRTSVFLIGPMGSGKTAVGRYAGPATRPALPRQRRARSSARTGVDIPFIFEKEGEAGFRQREREAIEALTAAPGHRARHRRGAVLLPENRQPSGRARLRGRICRLRSRSRLHRVRHGRHRPLLAQGDDAAARAGQLMDARAPLYAQIADIIVSTDGRRVHSVAENILRELGVAHPEPQRGRPPGAPHVYSGAPPALSCGRRAVKWTP